MIFFIFFQVYNLSLHQSYLKSPLPVKNDLIKIAKKNFLWLKKCKNTSSSQLWPGNKINLSVSLSLSLWGCVYNGTAYNFGDLLAILGGFRILCGTEGRDGQLAVFFINKEPGTWGIFAFFQQWKMILLHFLSN